MALWVVLALFFSLTPSSIAAPPLPAGVTALAYSPDGKLLAAGTDRALAILDPNSGDVQSRIAISGPATALTFAPDGKTLAVATGKPGKIGEVRLYSNPKTKLLRVIAAHADLVYGLSISSDSKTLATGSYDRLVKLWDLSTGQELFPLKDHSDAVYAVAFQPGGKLLASVAADRAVKVWDATTGKRLYSLTDATDWLYDVAWRPDGQALAAAGVDKSIRISQVNATEGKLQHAFFAHDGPVLKLVFSPDGQALYSLAADRSLKVWDATKGAEIRTYPKLSADAFALAVRSDGKQFAVGRADSLVALYDPATAHVVEATLREKPKPPKITKATPNFAVRGQTLDVVVTGEHLDSVASVTANASGATVSMIAADRLPMQLPLKIELSPALMAGPIKLTAQSPNGESAIEFHVDWFPASSNKQGAKVDTTFAGALNVAGQTDEFHFRLTAGQEIGALVTKPTDSKLEPTLLWMDSAGKEIARGGTTTGFSAPAAGTYTLRLADRDFRGGANFGYRLHVGRVPIVTGVFPMSIQPGQTREVQLQGVFLDTKSVAVSAPADAKPGAKIPVPVASALGGPKLYVSELLLVVHNPIPIPGAVDSRLAQDWSFHAKKGQRLIVEVHARRLGLPLDPAIEILDARHQPLEQARLRCVAKTQTVLRDITPELPGIRLEAWKEFAVDDYVLIDQEVMRIAELPGHPDADCSFYAVDGKRLSYFGTSPAYHHLGAAVYKVQIHSPGTQFSANGFPVLPLYYRNDDGGPGFGKDACIFFDPPADGLYWVRVVDSRGENDANHAYRLTVRPPRPDFAIHAKPVDVNVAKQQSSALAVTLDRLDGFEGPVLVHLEGLPGGLSCPPTRVEARQTRATLAIAAAADAQDAPAETRLTLIGEAMIDGRNMTHSANLGRLKLADPGDLFSTIEQPEVTIRPGQETVLRVKVERRNGFAGRVPLEVRGLPHGVRALHVGLSGILITEKESTRTIALYAEPWVEPTEVPIVVLAKREGKNTEHAAPPVLLRVVK